MLFRLRVARARAVLEAEIFMGRGATFCSMIFAVVRNTFLIEGRVEGLAFGIARVS